MRCSRSLLSVVFVKTVCVDHTLPAGRRREGERGEVEGREKGEEGRENGRGSIEERGQVRCKSDEMKNRGSRKVE